MLPNIPRPKTARCYIAPAVDKIPAIKPLITYDPWCAPHKPKTIYYDDVLKAHNVIKENIQATPMTKAKASAEFGINLYYKRETVHATGSFHERGAIYALHSLTQAQRTNGIFTASLGNWAKALAYHAQKLSIPVTAYIPATGHKNCIPYCKDYGATVYEAGETMSESRKLAIDEMIDTTGAFDCYINGYDHPHVIAGAGTIAIEILEQLPEVDAILLPIGGGGLLAGVAAVIKKIKPDILIYGMEPYKSCCFYKALVNERPYSIKNELTIPIAGWNAFHTARSLIDKVILVNDDCIARSLLHFMEEERFIVEPVSGTALACLFIEPNVVPELRNKNVVCVITGGSVDIMTFPRALNRGMVAEGRIISMKIALPIGRTDKIEKALILIDRMGCSIIHHDMEHVWINTEDMGYLYTVEYDPMCDKENPQRITFEDVSAAAFRIQSEIVKTPCVKSHMSTSFGMEIYLKNDFLQHTGSFKERGARNAMLLLSKEKKAKGIISASLGNHSQALSYHAYNLNIPTTVVMPNVAPIMKIEKCRSYGANVIVHGNDMKEAKYHAMTLAKEKGLTYINGYDHPHIMAGQGTVGLEIVEQVPDVDAVLVPVGGGGLLAGVATAIKHLKPHVLIYGVETEKCPSMKHAMNHEGPVSVAIRSTLADGLAVPTVGYNAFVTIRNIVDKMITVNEDWIARAILHLIEQEKYVVEGGGAVGVAAIMAGLVPELVGKKVVCILSGGNIDTTILGRCLERGLAAEQRLVKFKVTVSDRPGGIAELCKLISSTGVSIKDIIQERAWVHGDIFSVRVKVVCETRGPEHLEELRAVIANAYREWDFAGEYDALTRRNSSESLDDVSH